MSTEKIENFKQEGLLEIETQLFNLDEAVENNKTMFLNRYKKQLEEILNEIIKLQKDENIQELGTISVVLSRINIDNELFTYKMYLYGEKLYVDEFEYSFNIDVSDVYKYFMDTKNNLYKNAKKYFGVFEPCDVDKEIYQYLKYFNMYVVNLLREVLSQEEIKVLLKEIKTTADFYIIQNELYEKPYLLYKIEIGGDE